MLNEVPHARAWRATPPTDPLIYRSYELLRIQPPIREGADRGIRDGIMSAIDFDDPI